MLTVVIRYRSTDGPLECRTLVASVNSAKEARAYQLGLEREGFEFVSATLLEIEHEEPTE